MESIQFFISITMKSKTIRFLSFLLPCLFACSIGHAYQQDNWYLDREVKLPEMPGFRKPFSVEIDASGKSYVVDTDNDSITIWDQNGTFLRRIGSNGGANGQMSDPVDIAVTTHEIYVIERGNHRVQVFDLNGNYLRKWGSHGSSDGQLRSPRSIALDLNGSSVISVFVADWDNHEVQVFDANGTFQRSIGGQGNGDEQFQYASGVAIGPDGLLYASSRNTNKIKVFETNGTYVRSFATAAHPTDIDFHGDKLAIGNGAYHKIKIFDKNGTELNSIGSGSSSSASGEFNRPYGLSYAPNGELHVADSENHRIQVFDANANYLRSYGVYGQSGVDPFGLHITPENTFLVTDVSRHRVFEIDENGTFVRSIAVQGSGDGQVNNPRSVFLGPDNRIYVADTSRHRIQIFDRNGTFIRKFGVNGSGDGEFREPHAVLVSANNEVYVADSSNHRIQVFDSNGNFLRKFGSLGNLEGQMHNVHDIAFSDQGNLMVADWHNRRIIHFTPSGQFIRHYTTHEHPMQIGNLPHGLTAVSRDSRMEIYDENGDRLKRWTKSGGSSSAFDTYPNGTIAWLNYNHDKILFYRPTYRTVRRPISKEIPLPEVLNVVQQESTNHLQVTYRINDADSSKVEAKMIAFIDGGNDLSKVIIPSTFAGSIAGKLDQNVSTNQNHTITWNVGADWNVGFGELEVAIMAKDDRDLLNLHFLTLPVTDSNASTLQINRSPVTDSDLLDLWFWLLASGDSGINLEGSSIKPIITGSGPNFLPNQVSDMIVWLDANNVDGDGQNNNDPFGNTIESWANLVDSDHNFTQSNVSKRPTLTNGILNGKPGVFFDNDNDGMSSGLQINSAPYSVVVLFNCLDQASQSRRAVQGSQNWLIGPHGGRVGFHTSNGWVSNSEYLIKDKFYLCTALVDSSSSALIVNGIDRTQNSNSRYHPGGLHLAASGGHSNEDLNGYICELLVYNRKLNDSEVSQIDTYFTYKWNMVGSYVDGSSTTASGRRYLFDKMNLREASEDEVTRAKNGAISGSINQFTPSLQIGPGDRPNKVNEYGFDTGGSGSWVTPK